MVACGGGPAKSFTHCCVAGPIGELSGVSGDKLGIGVLVRVGEEGVESFKSLLHCRCKFLVWIELSFGGVVGLHNKIWVSGRLASKIISSSLSS